MNHDQHLQNLVQGLAIFAGVIISGGFLALVFALRILKPFARVRVIRKARRKLFS